jgi:hypothetical protein
VVAVERNSLFVREYVGVVLPKTVSDHDPECSAKSLGPKCSGWDTSGFITFRSKSAAVTLVVCDSLKVESSSCAFFN